MYYNVNVFSSLLLSIFLDQPVQPKGRWCFHHAGHWRSQSGVSQWGGGWVAMPA